MARQVSDGIPVVTWDDPYKMEPGLPAASRSICTLGCSSLVMPEEQHMGEVWVEFDMARCAITMLGSSVKWFSMIREEGKGYAILPAAVAFVSWRNRSHSCSYVKMLSVKQPRNEFRRVSALSF